jgi:hypothetical protein
MARRGSNLRFVVGVLLCMMAVVTSVYGFVRLTSVLDQGGYGTSAQHGALLVLGLGGALLATGIATVIWDVSQRYESPDKP